MKEGLALQLEPFCCCWGAETITRGLLGTRYIYILSSFFFFLTNYNYDKDIGNEHVTTTRLDYEVND